MAIIWGVSPEILDFGWASLRWYGLLFALAFVLGLAFLRRIYRREGLPPDDLDALFIGLVVGTIAGARIAHVLFYDPGYYFSRPLEIFMLWKGGLASHGAIVGILVAVAIHSRKHPDQPLLWLVDRLSFPVLIGAILVRLGNLFNSEILGRPADVPWAFVFVRVDAVPRHPVQLYEALAYLFTFLVLLMLYRRKGPLLRGGALAGPALAIAFTFRLLLEVFKAPQEEFLLPGPLSMGQLLSLPGIAVGLALTIRAWGRKAGGG
jgi:phosphatidylglycerol---prolipoprotein diacylglyceryl transferase